MADELQQMFEQEMLLATAGRQAAEAYEKLAEHIKQTEKAAKKAAAAAAAEAKALKDAQKAWDDRMKAMRDGIASAQSLFVQGTVALSGFVAAASPAAFNTLTGSVQLLAGSIGQAFMPQVLEAARTLQKAAHWVQSLDEGMKSNMARWVAYGVAALGTVTVLGRIKSAVVDVIGVFKGMSSAIGTIPTVASAAAALVAVAAAQQAARDARKRAAETETSAADLRNDPKIAAILKSGQTDQEKRKALEALASERKVLSVQAGREAREAMAGSQRGWGILGKLLTGSERITASTDERLTKAAEAAKAFEVAVDALSLFSKTGTKGFMGAAEMGGATPAGRRQLALAFPKEMMPGFNPIEQARRLYQVAGLGKDPLEMERLELERKSFQKLQEIARNTGSPAGFGP